MHAVQNTEKRAHAKLLIATPFHRWRQYIIESKQFFDHLEFTAEMAFPKNRNRDASVDRAVDELERGVPFRECQHRAFIAVSYRERAFEMGAIV